MSGSLGIPFPSRAYPHLANPNVAHRFGSSQIRVSRIDNRTTEASKSKIHEPSQDRTRRANTDEHHRTPATVTRPGIVSNSNCGARISDADYSNSLMLSALWPRSHIRPAVLAFSYFAAMRPLSGLSAQALPVHYCCAPYLCCVRRVCSIDPVFSFGRLESCAEKESDYTRPNFLVCFLNYGCLC